MNESLYREEVIAVKEYSDLSRAEESFLRQKSRIQWLNLGDKNSKFFFKALKNYYNRSKIVSICGENGTRIDNPKDVKEEIVKYLKNLLSAAPQNTQIDLEALRKALPKKMTRVQFAELGRDVTEEEIK